MRDVPAFEIRPIEDAEVDSILEMLDAWESREFFARYFTGDPAFRPELVCAAFHGARPISCAQIVPKTVRVVGGTAAVGGIGQVWTEPEYRRRGIAPRVLRRCLEVMRAEDFALSLMFASRFEFYGALGWLPYGRARSAIVSWPETGPAVAVRPFDRARDLTAVRGLYDAYTATVPGVTIRDAQAWDTSLRNAGYPWEEFLVATNDAGAIVAYLRGVESSGTYVGMEFARAAGAEDAVLALLIAHGPYARACGGFILLDMAHDPALRKYLAAAGCEINPIEDPFVMWRVVNAHALPGAPAQPTSAEAEAALLERYLPRAEYTYWPSDQF